MKVLHLIIFYKEHFKNERKKQQPEQTEPEQPESAEQKLSLKRKQTEPESEKRKQKKGRFQVLRKVRREKFWLLSFLLIKANQPDQE